MNSVVVTVIGGPTALLELAGTRILTDPTFDPSGKRFELGPIVLAKTEGPAIGADALGPIDLILLSHDEHPDNLDESGRALLPGAQAVVTTTAAARRLGANAIGLEPWQSVEWPGGDGRTLVVTATPARHGSAGIEEKSGPVIGFVLTVAGQSQSAIYISGDTVFYEGVEEVARRFRIGLALLFMGGAIVPEYDPEHVTMTAQDGVMAAHAFSGAAIVPLHVKGWTHYSESLSDVARAFEAARLQSRLHVPPFGAPVELTF